ncbi:MAG: hypothetical protein K2O04_02280 [Clostridiales bacterium]|nr:hypothetical protein [Clostridiales bacterium]
MIKKRLLLTACMLCMFATLLFVPAMVSYAKADVAVLADEPSANAILNSDDGAAVPNGLALNWTYGDDNIISYTFRAQHGDTVYYTVSSIVGEEKETFAVKYIGNTAELYEVKDGTVLDTLFRVNSLNAYLKTLKAGKYLLNVNVPSGIAPDNHEHWWDNDNSGEVSCGVAYSEVTLDVNLTVSAYELTKSNVGESTSTDENVTIKYRVLNTELPYTDEANIVPQIELVFDRRVLVEGEDYTLSSDNEGNVGNADLTITGIGGFSGEVTIQNAYKIVQAYNSVSGVYVVRWKYGEYDRNVNLFTADVKWGVEDLYFSIATDAAGENLVEGLEEIRLENGVVSQDVEQLLNKLDAKKTYYLYATVQGCNNYYNAHDYTQFEVVEVTNTWTTTPNIVSWEWHGFDENINVINAVPAFGDGVKFSVYTKDGDEYTAIKFDGKDCFELEEGKAPAKVSKILANLDAGTYYLFASLISDTENYTSINENFSADALVQFRVTQARNYWTQIPKLSNWAYGEYNPEVNVISATAAHGSSGIKYRVYKQSGEGFGLLNFNGTTSFTVNAEGSVPTSVSEGLKLLEVGKYYLRAEIAATKNYTGLLETVADFSELPSFEVIKAENYWSTAPAITTWAEGKYSNEDNIPVAASHHGIARIVIVDVDDEENVIYDSANNINKLSEAKVGAYLLTATVAGTANYSELTFDTIFHIFVPETDTIGMAWWLVLIIVICSLGVLVFIFWLLHDKGVLQMLTSKAIVAMRTKATMDATIASVRANKIAEEARESVRLAEELERIEAEKAETEEDDSDEEEEAILIESDEESGFATFVSYQRPFSVKLIQATDEAKERYSYLKNILLSYKKVKSKVSKGYDAFSCGRNQLAKLVIRGKTLCLYLALDPDDYEDTKYRVERSQSKKFAETPCLFRIKSQRRLGYAEELIAQLCEKLVIVQGENKNEDYRPPYESTEALLEKGLIKKVTYKRKINNVIKDNQGVGAETKTEDESKLAQKEVEPNETDEKESVENAVEPTETAAAPEQEAAAAEDKQHEEQSNADSEAGTQKNKKTTRSKQHVAKK